MNSVLASGGRGPFLLSMSLLVLAMMQGIKGYRALEEVAVAQIAVTESVERWKQDYMALAESVTRWERSYRRDDSLQDLASLYASIGIAKYGLEVEADNLSTQKIEPVAYNGMQIGLTKVCLATAGAGEGLEVRAGSYQALLDGVKVLAARPDVHVGTIAVRGDKVGPAAMLGEFCMLLRAGGGRE